MSKNLLYLTPIVEFEDGALHHLATCKLGPSESHFPALLEWCRRRCIWAGRLPRRMSLDSASGLQLSQCLHRLFQSDWSAQLLRLDDDHDSTPRLRVRADALFEDMSKLQDEIFRLLSEGQACTGEELARFLLPIGRCSRQLLICDRYIWSRLFREFKTESIRLGNPDNAAQQFLSFIAGSNIEKLSLLSWREHPVESSEVQRVCDLVAGHIANIRNIGGRKITVEFLLTHKKYHTVHDRIWLFGSPNDDIMHYLVDWCRREFSGADLAPMALLGLSSGIDSFEVHRNAHTAETCVLHWQSVSSLRAVMNQYNSATKNIQSDSDGLTKARSPSKPPRHPPDPAIAS